MKEILESYAYPNGIAIHTEERYCKVTATEENGYKVLKKDIALLPEKIFSNCIIIVAIIVAIFEIMEVDHTIIENLIKNLSYLVYYVHYAGIALICMAIVGYIVKIIIANKNKGELRKYNAAIHMAINVYCQINCIPTIEEVKTQKKLILKNCESNSFIYYVFIGIYLYYISFPTNAFSYLIYAICGVIGLLLIFILHKIGCFKFLHLPLIKVPEERHISLAIKAMEECLK